MVPLVMMVWHLSACVCCRHDGSTIRFGSTYSTSTLEWLRNAPAAQLNPSNTAYIWVLAVAPQYEVRREHMPWRACTHTWACIDSCPLRHIKHTAGVGRHAGNALRHPRQPCPSRFSGRHQHSPAACLPQCHPFPAAHAAGHQCGREHQGTGPC